MTSEIEKYYEKFEAIALHPIVSHQLTQQLPTTMKLFYRISFHQGTGLHCGGVDTLCRNRWEAVYKNQYGNSLHLEITDEVLFKLHQQHVHQVPFENVDIYLKRHFSLELEKVFQKIVSHKRGGFCYELNLLFNWLLNEVGFSSRIIASRIYNENGTLGPPFDHMSGYVKTNKAFLVDVGYGDLFVIPLEIKEGIQYDGRNYFRIEKLNENDFSLSMSPDGLEFQKRYLFSLDTVHLDAFTSICFDKQTHPNSYFVKNLVCTKPTQNGRITIFNEKLIEKNNRHKTETLLQGNDVLKTYLKDKFDMEVDMDFIPYHQPKMVVPVGINEI